MRKCSVLALAVLVLCLSWLPALAAEEAPLVFGILEIRGLDSLAASAFELSKAVGSPTPKEMVSMMLYGMLGSMPGMGIAPDGTVRAIAFENGTDHGGLALLLPVENNGTDYLTNLGQAGWENQAQTADGIEHFIPPEGSGLAWDEVYFLKRGATLLAAHTAAEVRKADAAMSALPPVLPVEGDVAVQIRPATLVEAFAPQIAEQMDQAFKAPGLPPEAAAMGELYLNTYLSAAKQLDEVVLGLGVASGNVNIHSRVAPVAGTTLARWMASLQTPAAAAGVVALPEALAVETINVGNLDLLAPAYFRFVEQIMKAMPASTPSPEAFARYMENEKACYAQLAGDFGIALLPPATNAPLRLAEYVALKDPSVLRSRMPEMIQSANDILKAAFAAESNVTFSIDLALGAPRDHRGIAVDKVAYTLVIPEDSAFQWPDFLPTKFDIEIAWLPDGMLASIGDPTVTDSLVDRALDGTAARLTDRPAWKTAFPDPDDNLVDAAHFALFDTLRAYLALGDAITGGSNAAMVPDGPGNLEGVSYTMDGLMNRLRFSLADVAAIGLKIADVKAKAMANMQQQMDMSGEMQIEDDDTGSASDDVSTVDEDLDDTGADVPADETPAAENPDKE